MTRQTNIVTSTDVIKLQSGIQANLDDGGMMSRLVNDENTQRNKMSSVSSDRYDIRVRVVLFYNGLFKVTQLLVK